MEQWTSNEQYDRKSDKQKFRYILTIFFLNAALVAIIIYEIDINYFGVLSLFLVCIFIQILHCHQQRGQASCYKYNSYIDI